MIEKAVALVIVLAGISISAPISYVIWMSAFHPRTVDGCYIETGTEYPVVNLYASVRWALDEKIMSRTTIQEAQKVMAETPYCK